MVVTQKLDLTPLPTFSNIQFRSEVLNVIISSLLTSLTAANIDSVISKVVYLTHGTTFKYDSWLRSYIFANSDDPVRIWSWISRKYVYRDPRWKRAPHRLKLSRLALPLIARSLVLFTTVASIIIAIPREREFPGCERGDYVPRWNVSDFTLTDKVEGICENIPLKTRLGNVKSVASYCTETQRREARTSVEDVGISVVPTPEIYTIINATQSDNNTRFDFAVSNASDTWTMSFRIELRRHVDENDILFLTNISALTMKEYMQIAGRALEDEEKTNTCNTLNTTITATHLSRRYNCSSNIENVFLRLKRYTQHAITWEQQTQPQVRLKRVRGQAEEFTTDCPYVLTVSVPVLNILPLVVALCISFALNIVVTMTLSRHGNALDAAFHVVKDALGRDSTSNPLEENEECEEISELKLQKWLCHDGSGGHISFLGRDGEDVVDKFEDSLIIGGCAKTAAELRRIIKMSGE